MTTKITSNLVTRNVVYTNFDGVSGAYSMPKGTFTQIAELDTTITLLSDSSLVKLDFSICGFSGVAAAFPCFIVSRNGTNVSLGQTAGNRVPVTFSGDRNPNSNDIMQWNFSVIDEPAVNGDVTYGIKVGQVGTSTTGTFYLNRSNSDDNTNSFPRTISSLIVEEIQT